MMININNHYSVLIKKFM